jgi:hypothetical protein
MSFLFQLVSPFPTFYVLARMLLLALLCCAVKDLFFGLLMQELYLGCMSCNAHCGLLMQGCGHDFT